MAKDKKKKRAPRSKRRASITKQDKPNVWAFAIHLVDAILELINNTKFFALSFVLIGGIAVITALRMPDEAFIPFWSGLFGVFSNNYAAYGLLIFTNCIWYIAYSSLKRESEREIERVTELRKHILHGLEKGTLTVLESHTSSKDHDDSLNFIFPIDDDDKSV